MWADNETDVDLLGFDYLVDNLFVALTEPRLLPVTVGLLGDWGSGKSSLMRITRQELLDEGPSLEAPRYLCVEFSPWQYEDFDDVKVALMTAVLDKISERVGGDEVEQDKVARLRRFVQGLGRWARRVGRVGVATGQVAGPVVVQVLNRDIDPQVLEIAKAGMTAVATEAGKLLEDPKPEPLTPSGDENVITDAGRFRAEFAALVQTLSDVDAVVVFIDDLDRCLPDTVVDTFEVIRLFLNTPKTAYVLAVNQAVVEAAIDYRFRQMSQPDEVGIGARYLEKMLQLKVGIPSLSAPEADTYVNLLLAELRLDEDTFATVMEATRARREAGNLHVAFNLGIAGEILGDVPAELAADLEWADSISDILGSGLRGNPRQLKRFLNDMLLRHRSAKRRKIDLQRPVLAKLMALEEQHIGDYQTLFNWYLAAPGPIGQLADAEAHVRAAPAEQDTDTSRSDADGETPRPSAGKTRIPTTDTAPDPAPELPSEVTAWAEQEHIRKWLLLGPELGSTDLGRYFTYSRDKLSAGIAVSRLLPHLQELLNKIQSTSPAVQRSACTKVGSLPDGERTQLVEALLEMLARRPKALFVAVLELANRVPATVAPVCDALLRLPPGVVPVHEVPKVFRRIPADEPKLAELRQRWENSGLNALETAVRESVKLAARNRKR
jgi:hypothetical protein